jgi:hypothetical protein
MEAERTSTIIEQTRAGLTVRLGEGARLVRLGPSTVLVADPDRGDTAELAAALPLNGGSLITCMCRGPAECRVVIRPQDRDKVEIACDPSECKNGCTRTIVDRFFDSPFIIQRMIGDLFAGEPLPDDE